MILLLLNVPKFSPPFLIREKIGDFCVIDLIESETRKYIKLAENDLGFSVLALGSSYVRLQKKQ